MKRAFDIFVSGLALLLLWPLMLVVTLAIALSMGSPVLFRQKRAGRHGRLFTIYKFRTMCEAGQADADDQGDEHRLTRLGQWLRRTSLDELPELWNILLGDMSLVGPRPLLPEYLPLYNERQAKRHDVRPGLTGLAQVEGRNDLPWDDRLELDVKYVNMHSIGMDIGILIKTISVATTGRGISAAGHSTMPRFEGSHKPEQTVPSTE